MTDTALSALPTSGLWAVDPIHSTARFSVRHHAVATFHASFSQVGGQYDGGSGTLTGEVRVENVQVQMGMLRDHMQTPQFFAADEHPTISFVSTSITGSADDLTVEGDLTIRGTTRRVKASGRATTPLLVNHPDGSQAEHFGIDLNTIIDRRDFDLEFNSELPGGQENLGWDVAIEVSLELIAIPA